MTLFRCLLLISIFLNGVTSIQISQCYGHPVAAYKGNITDSNTMLQLQAPSTLQCASMCMGHECCQAFFYVNKTGYCQLHSATLKTEDVLRPEEGAAYYEMCKDRQHKAFDCTDLLESGRTTSGVYMIYPYGTCTSREVYCDQITNGGGWLVLQRRQDGSEDFYRTWKEYENGFGSLTGEFWLGLELMHVLTSNRTYELLVELEDFDNQTAYAAYSEFSVSNSDTFYVLTVGAYSGTAGDALKTPFVGYPIHDRAPFSTKDQDHSGSNCAVLYTGGFWYGNKVSGGCHFANLNGQYLGAANTVFGKGIHWHQWKGQTYSLKGTELKIRRKG